jgi:hypothetical protein
MAFTFATFDARADVWPALVVVRTAENRVRARGRSRVRRG